MARSVLLLRTPWSAVVSVGGKNQRFSGTITMRGGVVFSVQLKT